MVSAPADLVIHAAAATPKARGYQEVDAIVHTNVRGTHALLSSLDPSVRRVVYISTIDVYAPPVDARPLDEHASLGPSGVYAATKLLGETLVAQRCEELDIESCILRLGHLYGPGEESYEKFVPQFIKQLARGRPPTIVGDEGTLRDLLYVEDAVEAVVRGSSVPAAAGRTLNVAGRSYSVGEVLDTLIAIFGYVGPVRRRDAGVAVGSLRFSQRAMTELLGAWPLTELETGLRREVAHVTDLLSSRSW